MPQPTASQTNAQKNVALLKESEAEKEDMRKSEREAVDTAKKVRRSISHGPVQRYAQQYCPLNYSSDGTRVAFSNVNKCEGSEITPWLVRMGPGDGEEPDGMDDEMRIQGVSSTSEFCQSSLLFFFPTFPKQRNMPNENSNLRFS